MPIPTDEITELDMDEVTEVLSEEMGIDKEELKQQSEAFELSPPWESEIVIKIEDLKSEISRGSPFISSTNPAHAASPNKRYSIYG